MSVKKRKGRGKKSESERPVFDSVRKPLAPPGKKIGEDKPSEKAYPAGRKAKHKKSVEAEES